MRVLILGNTSSVFPKELRDELSKKAIKASLLDNKTLELFLDGLSVDRSYLLKFKKYRNIPKVNVLVKLFLIGKIIKYNNFDVVNIHYSFWQAIILLILFRKLNVKFIITFYGSDFYRSSLKMKKKQTLLYRLANALTFTNPVTKEEFVNLYHDFEEKSYVCRFGLKTLDYIDKNREKSKAHIKKHLNYKIDKVIVTCGYNATKAQQHEKIINELSSLDANLLSKIQFIFPLTYGDERNRDRVKNLLKESELDYLVLDKFLYEDDNAYIKLGSDIMINVLQTDSFSGSMQEFLYAENIVITGKWLPYTVLDNHGIKYIKIDQIENALGSKLNYAVENISSLKKELEININIVSRLSSWNNTIDRWLDTFENTQK